MAKEKEKAEPRYVTLETMQAEVRRALQVANDHHKAQIASTEEVQAAVDEILRELGFPVGETGKGGETPPG